MNRHYLFGVVFIGLGIFHLSIRDFLDAALYCMAGLAFIVNASTSEPKLAAYKKVLVIVTWVLIIASSVLFLYLIQERYF